MMQWKKDCANKAKEAAEEARESCLEDGWSLEDAYGVYKNVYAQVYDAAYCNWFI